MWQCLLIILIPGRLRQEDVKFEASLGYMRKPVSEITTNNTGQGSRQADCRVSRLPLLP